MCWMYYLLVVALILVLCAWYAYRKRKGRLKEDELSIMQRDAITGLISTGYFKELVERKINSAGEGEYELLSIDIDRMRAIVKRYGEEKGDVVVIETANGLSEIFGSTKALIAKATGERFYVLNSKKRKVDMKVELEKIIPRLRKVLDESFDFSFSVGACEIEKGVDVADAMENADLAKEKGAEVCKITLYEFDEAMRAATDLAEEVIFRAKKGFEDNEFEAWYQPKIDLITLKMCGIEALVRWIPKDGSQMLYPDMFIPVFEKTNYIVDLDLYVFEEVCKFISKNFKTFHIPVISTNISSATLLDDDFVTRVRDITYRYFVSPSRIELELTEGALQEGVGVNEKIRVLKEMGFGIAIDDFGAEYSSLNRLTQFDVDTLKLDKKFLSGSTEKEVRDGVIIIDNVVRMAKGLGFKVVCEGVETYDHVSLLQQLGCDTAQGYCFSKPVNAGDMKELLRNSEISCCKE